MENLVHRNADYLEILVDSDRVNVCIVFYKAGNLLGTYVGPSFDFRAARDIVGLFGLSGNRTWESWTKIDGPPEEVFERVAIARLEKSTHHTHVQFKTLVFPPIEGMLTVDPFGNDTDEICILDIS